MLDRKKSRTIFGVKEQEMEERKKRMEKNLRDVKDFVTGVSGELDSDEGNTEHCYSRANITDKARCINLRYDRVV